MTGTHHRARRLVAQLFVTEAGRAFAFGNAADHEVEAAAPQLLQQHVTLLHFDANAQPRSLLLDAREGARQQGDPRRHDGADFHLAGQSGLEGNDVFMRQRQAGQRHARMTYHGLAVDGRLHAARQALEQLHAQHFLQVLQLLGGGRLRHVQLFGCAVNIALLVQGDQQQQLARLQAGTQKPVRVSIHRKMISRWILKTHDDYWFRYQTH